MYIVLDRKTISTISFIVLYTLSALIFVDRLEFAMELVHRYFLTF